MTIMHLAGPPAGDDVLDRALEDRFPEVARRGVRVRSRNADGVPELPPVPCFHLGLDMLADDEPLRLAQQTGWRYIVEPGNAVGMAKLSSGTGGTRYEGLAQGLLVERYRAALALAQELLGADHHAYEPRLLDVPALSFAALWLKGPQDWFIELLDGVPPGTAALQVVDDILPELRHRAAKREPYDDPGDRPTPTN